MSAQRLTTLVHRCHAKFRYVADDLKYGQAEFWMDCSEIVKADREWQGDCEDWAITLLVLALEEGLDSEHMGMAYVKTPAGEGHAVVWIENETGRYWADCNNNCVRQVTGREFDWISYMKMSSPTEWLSYADED